MGRTFIYIFVLLLTIPSVGFAETMQKWPDPNLDILSYSGSVETSWTCTQKYSLDNTTPTGFGALLNNLAAVFFGRRLAESETTESCNTYVWEKGSYYFSASNTGSIFRAVKQWKTSPRYKSRFCSYTHYFKLPFLAITALFSSGTGYKSFSCNDGTFENYRVDYPPNDTTERAIGKASITVSMSDSLSKTVTRTDNGRTFLYGDGGDSNYEYAIPLLVNAFKLRISSDGDWRFASGDTLTPSWKDYIPCSSISVAGRSASGNRSDSCFAFVWVRGGGYKIDVTPIVSSVPYYGYGISFNSIGIDLIKGVRLVK
ncbi:MAG TPA: hypothetical protein VJC04_01545 [Candidatus Paceibacterota bacterium]